MNDLKRVTTSDLRRMYVLVTLGVYAILVALLRRPGISLYLVATLVLDYLASLGLTDLFFHALHRGPGTWDGLDWTVGFFLFVILVAVGEDYNILLMARVIEEERKYGVTEGTRTGSRSYRRHHQLVRFDHGRNIRIDADGKLDLTPRARICARAGRPARHVSHSADPGPCLRRPDRSSPVPEPAPRSLMSGGKRSSDPAP